MSSPYEIWKHIFHSLCFSVSVPAHMFWEIVPALSCHARLFLKYFCANCVSNELDRSSRCHTDRSFSQCRCSHGQNRRVGKEEGRLTSNWCSFWSLHVDLYQSEIFLSLAPPPSGRCLCAPLSEAPGSEGPRSRGLRPTLAKPTLAILI